MKSFCLLSILLIFIATGCKQKTDPAALENFCQKQLPQWNQKLTQVIITDIFTPPVCSRIYAYCNIAAYEAMLPAYKQYSSYAGRLNNLQPIPQPKLNTNYCYPVSGVIAFTTVAQKLVFNHKAIAEMENDYLKELGRIEIDEEIINRSVEFGRAVGNHIIAWAAKDGYLQRTSFPAYIVTKEFGRWQPTGPDYMDAIEPNWRTIRPFVLDSAAQFRPPIIISFDTARNSPFYKEAMKVYETVKNNKQEHIAIANFWDCNPNASVTQGHVTYFQQKISPGGHWMHVAAQIAANEQYDVMRTADILSKLSIAIADAFISCWEAKYQYNVLRPESYIGAYIDKEWKPLLQTPAFPEYPSGHSVASATASTLLTHLIGENYTFIDSTEIPFGQPPRKFSSFTQAASEASLSRLYGGIHYMPAITNGMEQGRKIGNYVIKKLTP